MICGMCFTPSSTQPNIITLKKIYLRKSTRIYYHFRHLSQKKNSPEQSLSAITHPLLALIDFHGVTSNMYSRTIGTYIT